MKKLFAVLMLVTLLAGTAAAEDFRTMTKLDELQAKLDTGVTIEKVFYTDCYGFSISEFTTDNREEIDLLWTALNKITVKERVEMSITDWYPEIVFSLSDGTCARITFESHWLHTGMDNYELENADEFWLLTAALVKLHTEMEYGPIPGGWN